jgi:hypothetical protein
LLPQDKKSNSVVQAHFSVTDGRDALGTVDLIDGAFVAVDVNGATVGRYASLRQAVRAFDDGNAR